MKATEFCYWLQGLCELHNPKEFNEHQTQLIKAHLQMVFLHDKNFSEAFSFCKDLHGYLSFSESLTINEKVTTKIKNELNKLFVHEVQPDLPVFNSYHKKGMQLEPDRPSELIRC